MEFRFGPSRYHLCPRSWLFEIETIGELTVCYSAVGLIVAPTTARKNKGTNILILPLLFHVFWLMFQTTLFELHIIWPRIAKELDEIMLKKCCILRWQIVIFKKKKQSSEISINQADNYGSHTNTSSTRIVFDSTVRSRLHHHQWVTCEPLQILSHHRYFKPSITTRES